MPAAWTTPRNWTAGELVTAAIGNSAWRDNLMYLKDSPVFDGNVTVTGTTLLTGVATLTAAPVFSSATASQAVFTNGSKALVSNAITGTGNVVMSASPTLTGTIAGSAMTLSSTLGVTGATTLSSTVATGALTVTGAATVSTTLGVTGATTLSSTVATGALTVTGAATVSTTLGVTGATTLSSGTYSTFLKSTTALATPAALTATQATAFASTVSGSAIMGFGTTNDVALMNRAGTVVLGVGPNTTTVNMTGLLTVSGFGTHSFSASGAGFNAIQVENTTSGAAARAYALVTAGSVNAQLFAFSQGYTTGTWDKQAATALYADGAGGISIVASNASGAIRFYAGGTTLRGSFDTSGNLGLVLPLKLQNNSSAMTTALAMSGNAYDVVILGGNSNYSGLYYSATVPAANAGLNGAVQVTTTGSIYFYSGGSRYVLAGVLA